jgi:hypothetical protein
MPSYRYLLCDLLTDEPLATLPLSGVAFERRISRTGTLSGTLQASTPALVETARLLQANVGKAALWVYRDNAIWWGGIPWSAPVQQGVRGPVTLSVSAATFDSYAHKRQLREDKTYAQVDDGAIIPDLWRWLQDHETGSGDIGVIAEDQPTGVLRDRTYLAADQSFIGKLVEDLGDVIDGPEHTIDVYVEADGTRVKRLRVGSTLGGTVPQIVFSRSARDAGSVLQWSDSVDAMSGGTVFQTRGDAPNGNVGEDVQPLLSELVTRWDLLDQGYPVLDVTEDRPGVIEQATLDEYAAGLAAEFGGAIRTRGYQVQVGNTGWTPNRVGEPVRIKLRDAWHTDSDLLVRPVGCSVQAAEKGQPETVTLMFGDE